MGQTALGIIVASFLVALVFQGILKSNGFALGLVFTTALTRALFHLAGLPRMVPVLITEFCVLLFLVKALYSRLIVQGKPLVGVGVRPMVGIFLVSILSWVANDSDALPAVFFLRKTFVFYFFFLALQNVEIAETTMLRINRYLVFIFFVQLPAAGIKVMMIGPEEGRGIGMVSWHSGALSTTLPLFVVSFLLSFYFFKKEAKYLILTGGFLLFGLAGLKRAVLFMFPPVAILVGYLHGKRWKKHRLFEVYPGRFKYVFLMIPVFAGGLAAAAHFMTPDLTMSLDPVYRYQGSDKLRYIYDYVVSYSCRDYVDYRAAADPQNSMGRIRITIAALKAIVDGGWIQWFLGFGPGGMISSQHLGLEDAPFERFGIRGAMPGFVPFVLQTGFLGVIFICLFFFGLLKRAYRRYQLSRNGEYKMVALGFIGATCVFLWDFFLYSESTLSLGVLSPVYFYVATMVLRRPSESYRFLAPSGDRGSASILARRRLGGEGRR